MIRLARPACPNPSALEQQNYKHPVNKAALEEACHGKCMYCESPTSQVYYGDVEHIKPSARFAQLRYVWENLGYVCARCNGIKSDQWNDATPLVNPFEEEPSDHLAALGWMIWERNGSERGEYTWMILDLNRGALVEHRQERVRQIRTAVARVMRTRDPELRARAIEELRREGGDDRPYAMVSRAALEGLT